MHLSLGILVAPTKVVNWVLVIAGNSRLVVFGLSTKVIGLLVIFLDLYNQLQNAFTDL